MQNTLIRKNHYWKKSLGCQEFIILFQKKNFFKVLFQVFQGFFSQKNGLFPGFLGAVWTLLFGPWALVTVILELLYYSMQSPRGWVSNEVLVVKIGVRFAEICLYFYLGQFSQKIITDSTWFCSKWGLVWEYLSYGCRDMSGFVFCSQFAQNWLIIAYQTPCEFHF